MDASQRFFISIEFIEKNLFNKLSMDIIAQSAAVSTYHYCRIFKAIVGDSVIEYVRKRRLSEAADLLARTDTSILSIALQCQFESQEAFTRTFKQYFNETPGKYRKINEPFQLLYKKKFDRQLLEHRKHGLSLQPDIVDKPAMKIIGIPTVYEYDDFDLMKF